VVCLCVWCQESGPLYERAMVMNVLDHSFDVMIIKLGVIKRVYCEVHRPSAEQYLVDDCKRVALTGHHQL